MTSLPQTDTRAGTFAKERRQRLLSVLVDAGRTPIGTWVKLATPTTVEILVDGGLDFLVLDMEHSPLNLETAYTQIGLAQAQGMPVLVRLSGIDSALIGRLLDAGADGLIFPHVDTVEQAHRVVEVARFPPRGHRGIGNTSRAGRWGSISRTDYLADGEAVICIAQIESPEAVGEATGIAAVDGIDALLIGQADLSASMGQPETSTAVVDLTLQSIERARLAGVPIGGACGPSSAALASARSAGYDFMIVDNDASMLASGARATLDAVVNAHLDDVGQTWFPDASRVSGSNLTTYARWLRLRGYVDANTYSALHDWSIRELGEFWSSLGEFFGVPLVDTGEQALSGVLPEITWFPSARINYAAYVLGACPGPERVAIIGEAEDTGERTVVTWADLNRDVRALAAALQAHGVRAGDRVVGYLSNTPESIVSFLAAAYLGAVWSICGQDYSAEAVISRLVQLDPVVMIAGAGYRFAGRYHDRTGEVATVVDAIPSLVSVIMVGSVPNGQDWAGWDEVMATDPDEAPRPELVPFDHPLWVVYSSGTTGRPKGIVHGHGGVLLEHLKTLSLHMDLGPTDVFFWYTSPSWMLWNLVASGLAVGATVVCYAGAPTPPSGEDLWQIAARNGVTCLGVSPGFLAEHQRRTAGSDRDWPHDSANQVRAVGRLRTLAASGAVLQADADRWVHRHLGENVQVMSMSGGTDVVTAFATGSPWTPVRPGEISVPALGCALAAFDSSGRRVTSHVGELVVTEPMPSMPVGFWNDPDGSRYRAAYFAMYPRIWRHGDWITMTENAAVQIHGRSDATLNRNGVRMGSADIYEVVESISGIREALIIGVESGNSYWMPLFVCTDDGVELDESLTSLIVDELRERLSVRHVPDEVIPAPAIPHTRTGKKLEVPIKKLFAEGVPDAAVDLSVDDVAAFDWFRNVAKQRAAQAVSSKSANS